MKTRAAILVCVAAVFAAAASGAGAARVDETCTQPSGDNGATACTVMLDATVSGVTESPDVIACLGEDVFVTLRVKAVGHEVFRPDGSEDLSAHATIHGSGYGVLTGTRVVYNEGGETFLDNTPDGGEIFHTVAPVEVVTNGGAVNLELTIEAQFVVAPDGTIVNSTLNAQAKCGTSDHESIHQH
jgi:hypothetical protein